LKTLILLSYKSLLQTQTSFQIYRDLKRN